MRPFTPTLDPAAVADLRARLRAARFPDTPTRPKDPWALGAPPAYLREVCAYWADSFDWAAQQSYLNSFHHFKEEVEGLGIHFILEKGTGTTTTPLLLLHGWPDSFLRFLRTIPLLTAPDAEGHSFDVVVPSLPGFGFSDIPADIPADTADLSPRRIADFLTGLMTDVLGYDRFIVHGGDWGSAVAEQMAILHERHVYGLHLTDVPTAHNLLPVKDPSAREKAFLAKAAKWMVEEGGYFHQQSTFPQTIGALLADSPAGLAA